MPDHIVKQGEHLPRIAHDHGLSDYEAVWDHPQNAELKEKRKSPHVLMPGDVVSIPDKESKEESCATEQHHRFRMMGGRLMLRLRLLDCGHQPLANTACELHLSGTTHQLTTDEDGRIEQEVSATVESGILAFRDPLVPFDVVLKIKIGHLDPIDEPSGQKGRLRNLGYNPGPPKEHDEERLKLAIQEFQCDHGLPVTGDVDSVTRDKLKEVHGC